MLKTAIRSYYQSLSGIQKLAIGTLFFYVLIATLAPLIANEKPILCKCQGKWQSPGLNDFIGIKNVNQLSTNYEQCEWKWKPLVKFNATTIDASIDAYSPPLTTNKNGKLHLLGTDALGRDVLAGLIHGSRYAFLIGLGATILASIIGICFGLITGYFQNHKLKLSVLQISFVLLLAFITIYLSVVLYAYSKNILIPFFILLLGKGVTILFLNYFPQSFSSNLMSIPIDQIGMRLIDIFESFPKLLLLILLMLLFSRPGTGSLVLLIAILIWPAFAQLARAETIKVRSQNFVLSAENIGLPWWKIISKHIWPHISRVMIVTAIFSFSSTILIEATLSFLGLGLRLDQVSWGSILNEGRQFLPGWWLSVFPGLAIFCLLISINWLFDDLNTST